MIFDNANFCEDRAIWGADGNRLCVKVIFEQMHEWNKQFEEKLVSAWPWCFLVLAGLRIAKWPI